MQTSQPTVPVYASAIHSLSRPVPARVIMLASVVKSLQIASRYIPNLISRIVELALMLAFFFLLANSISFRSGASGGQELSRADMFIFFQGALLLLVFQAPTLWTPVYTVSQDLYNGTLEFLYSHPGSRYAYYVGSILADVLVSLVVFFPFYGLLIFYARPSVTNMLLVLLACGMVCVTLTAMGIMIAVLALLWRQINSIVNILSTLFQFLAGAYFSIQTFPKFVQYLAYPLPYTWGYDLIRYYSLQGRWQTILPVWQEWAILGVYAVLYTLLSRYLLKKAEQRAKQTGLHVI